ncbi:T9SS type A sorting domain-containing protein [Flavobacterium amniphilum]|uniref:DUF7619 domain-containing protein n=1 Tax=Flavobacterium amniphilum TaxID=1834035 RepID=UPI00202A6F04|nr:T9SS type A sorting domain-containing protein [Flavobacterium amniphilum]MCL9807377.1 T9SS type A sorting domain-containing protein [Flavobacterium amniphilum]
MKKSYLLFFLLVLNSLFSVYGQTCDAPTNLSASDLTGTTATTNWTYSGPATAWEIFIQPAGSPAPTTQPPSFVASANSYIITGLVPCTAYDVYVRTVCDATTRSNWSGPLSLGSNPGISASAVLTQNLNCTNPATVTVMATGGSGTYQYSVNGGPYQIPNVFTITQGGSYTFQVWDSVLHCSVYTGSIMIMPLTQPTVTATVVNNNIVVNGTGGAPLRCRIIAPAAFATPYMASGIFTNMPAGTYTVEIADNRNCTATTTVTLLPVIANDDAFTVYPVNGGISTSTYSVLSNDYQGPNLVNPSSFSVSATSMPSGFTLNPNGTVSVLSGIPTGVYTFEYSVFGTNNILIFDNAIATVTVVNEGIGMHAFIDSNANGIKEVGEPYFTQGQFGYELNNSGTVNYVASSNGDYFINESNPANSYDLTYVINPDFASQYTLSTASYTDVSFDPASGVNLYGFPIVEAPFLDLETKVLLNGTPPRPGFTYQNKIIYKNNGNLPVTSGTITFTKDSNVTVTNVSVSGTNPTATGFTYDFSNLMPGETRNITVTMLVPTIPTVSLGQALTNTVSATVPVNDINPNNNAFALTQIIVGSYDPNDKAESHGGKILHSAFTANDYLTYTIQFENTGTYYAENVRINDVLDAGLDETSVKMVDASHGYDLKRIGNNLSWSFDGIDLLPAGKGQVTFQIKPKPGYAIGDIIPNTASIYFDFNPAIVTNTFTTEFVNSLGNDEFTNGAFTLYPNPTNGIVNISLKDASVSVNSAEVMDVSGKVLFKKTINNPNAVVDLTSLANGMYFIKLKAGQQEKTLKVVKY